MSSGAAFSIPLLRLPSHDGRKRQGAAILLLLADRTQQDDAELLLDPVFDAGGHWRAERANDRST
jgi:hypothetical protein